MVAPAEQLAEGVVVLPLRTPTVPPATRTNTLVIAGDRTAVIEPASPHAGEQRRLDELVDRLAAEGRPVAAILVTHHHRDHVGDVERLRARLDAPVLAHPRTAERVAFRIDEEIGDGHVLDLGAGHRIEATHTPGHAPGHLVFVDRGSGVAHVGDLVAGLGTILIDPDDAGDMTQYLDSLRAMADRVRAAPGLRFVPAHGPTVEDPLALLEQYLAHRVQRERKIEQAVLAGATSMEEVLARAYADTPREVWPLARMSAEAHLRRLIAQHKVLRARGRLAPGPCSA